jgi:hypothetical protein
MQAKFGLGVLSLLTVGLLVQPAAGDAREYVYAGPVEFEVGHFGPVSEVTITVIDDVFSPMGATYCQTLLKQVPCHQQPANEVSLSSVDLVLESIPFCASITLIAGVNWNPGLPVTIIVDGGAAGGDPNVCGFPTYGTHGIVDHS